ncbi:ribonuclease [Sulfurovum lithotrophicum]|uniref:exoribonuclease II n=1 Tax=Sulfurovum lithotrophicum TaxID=206403 RepID=A0A7U4M2A6_9BACT|nr:ribonuclease R family protein [Sulfurovum lithotrophicum]AKF25505.1 ribonuclease [Sulfurovum lithotrophicum]
MSAFAVQLTNGCLPSDIELEDRNAFEELQRIGALEEKEGLWKLGSLYRAGELYIGKDGRGYVESQFKEQKDLLVEPDHLGDTKNGDTVVVKRIIARRGRASGKVVMVITKAHLFTIAYTHRDEAGNFMVLNIKTGEPIHAVMEGMDLKAFKLGTVMKVNVDDDKVLQVFGHLDDPRVDEKISLALYNRHDEFPLQCTKEALQIESEVTKAEHTDRIDLTHLDFCTIDPITAKDFDDAVYFDLEAYTLYVAIADVSHYVPYFTEIDKEAKKRGFTTYLPHKSFPMLPRELSENICSLKPKVDRLAFVAKITLDKGSLKPIKEEFFEAIIHSRHRFNYEAVDRIIETDGKEATGKVKEILHYLLPLYRITQRLRKERLKHGFDFRSEEIKLTLNEEQLLVSTQIETGTPSHSLIEECMLLANQASAKRFKGDGDSIFRIHEPPQLQKIEALLTELAAIGLYVEEYEDSPSLIRAIQKEAEKMGLSAEVDAMIIKSLRQASYSSHNVGHFGLGFSHYSHFTSPIRRYADLILHRLIKTQLTNDEEEAEYLLRNIEPLCVRVSDLEREATKAEWDFRDRKFARWAKTQIGAFFEAEVIEAEASEYEKGAKARLFGDIQGVVVHLRGDNIMLFDRIRVMITEVNIPQAVIMAELVNKLSKEEMEL